jgi:hypothetical protein
MRSLVCAAFVAFLLAGATVNAAPFPLASSGQLPVSASSSSNVRVENVLDPLLEPFQQSASSSCSIRRLREYDAPNEFPSSTVYSCGVISPAKYA